MFLEGFACISYKNRFIRRMITIILNLSMLGEEKNEGVLLVYQYQKTQNQTASAFRPGY